jgi:hypothetical protein
MVELVMVIHKVTLNMIIMENYILKIYINLNVPLIVNVNVIISVVSLIIVDIK